MKLKKLKKQKKAIIVILILFLTVSIVFAILYVLYVNNQPAITPSDGLNTDQANGAERNEPAQQKIEAIETKTNQQVEQIVEQGQTSTGGVTADAQREIEAAVNQEIMEKLKLRTPEQLKADQARQAELEKIEQEINQQIKSQLQNK